MKQHQHFSITPELAIKIITEYNRRIPYKWRIIEPDKRDSSTVKLACEIIKLYGKKIDFMDLRCIVEIPGVDSDTGFVESFNVDFYAQATQTEKGIPGPVTELFKHPNPDDHREKSFTGPFE